MNLAQRGGTIPESRQGVMHITGSSAEAVAYKIDAFTTTYFVRVISVTMVHIPMVPASAFGRNALFAPTVAEGEASDQPETDDDTPGPFQAVVIFEEESAQ